VRFVVLELPARWGDPERALADVDSELARIGHATSATDNDAQHSAISRSTIVVLPEASIHGYVSPDGDCDLAPFAEPIDGPTARACAALAAKHGVHLVAPLVLREDSALYNAMVAYDPRGAITFVYRKRHPWLPEEWATAGTEPLPVVEIDGTRISIAVCYDVHFLPSESARELEAADVLLFPSAWVEDPDYRVPRLQRLAQRFEIAIVNANWAPGDVRIAGQGGSCVVGADGRVVARVADGRVDWRR
jgi:predicted amidohydrolase